MSALALLQQVIESGRVPDPFLVEDACSEALAFGRVDLAIAISDAWPSDYETQTTIQDESPPTPESETQVSPPDSSPVPSSGDFPRMSSPFKGVTDDAWNDFVDAMRTEVPTFSTEKFVGAFRYRRQRMTDLGVVIDDNYDHQYDAFKRDMEIQYSQGNAKTLIDKYAGFPLAGDEQTIITPSGILALVKAAGPKAEDWITKPDTRSKFPGTSKLFQQANGIF